MRYDTVDNVNTVVAGYDGQLHNAQFAIGVNIDQEKINIEFKVEDNKSKNFPIAELEYDLSKFDGEADELISSIMRSVRDGYDQYDDRNIAFMFQNEQSLINDMKVVLEPHIPMEIEIGDIWNEKVNILGKDTTSLMGEFTVNGRSGTFELTEHGDFYVEADNDNDIALINRASDKIENSVKENVEKHKEKDYER